jgi:hypothetical protein
MVTQDQNKDQAHIDVIKRQVMLINKSDERMTNGVIELMARLKNEGKLDQHTISFLKAECKQMRLLLDNLEKKLEGV